MGAALLADVRSPVVDDYVVASALEVLYEISSNLRLRLFVINHDEPSGKTVRR